METEPPPSPVKTPPPAYKRWTLLGVGWVIVGVGLLIGPLPGPGPVLLVPLGLALILRNSIWAKRAYVRLSREHRDLGRWADWALGRSHRQAFRPRLPSIKELFRRLTKGRQRS